ncbi:hypothetical protein CR983_02470 [Candidatus Saccharibacteria bacterium]|nr:MAG: hypothetical protein CR983_02470 [Candidatus Saccharibacteria bacterium]
MKRTYQKGFTLVELLVVVIVIAVLAGLTTIAYRKASEDAKYANARSEINDIIQITRLASANSGGKTLGQILGYEFFAAASCLTDSVEAGVPMYDLPKTHSCWKDYHAMLDKLEKLSKQKIPQDIRDGDPWGSPYWLDANEGETYNGHNPCTRDLWGSAGPGGIMFRPGFFEIRSPIIALDYCKDPD